MRNLVFFKVKTESLNILNILPHRHFRESEKFGVNIVNKFCDY